MINRIVKTMLAGFLFIVPASVNVNAEGEEGPKDNTPTETETPEDENDNLAEELEIVPPTDESEKSEEKQDNLQQNNSIAMLNYITVLTQEINASKNNRLYLEEVYSSIINDTYPNAVDETTYDYFTELLNDIEAFRMITINRERVDYLYKQNQAKAIRAAVPNPLGLLSAVQSFNLKKLLASGIYMAIDSITNYNESKNEAEMKYLQGEWELDDKEAEIVSTLRREAFGYMIKIVNAHNIPGELALNEDAVNELVAWESNTNVVSRIQFLEDNYETYKQYGGYWLLRARSYYEHGDYAECLSDIETYEQIQGKIFKKDHALAEVMPYAIVSAQETIKEEPVREETIRHFVEQIISNTKNDDWALRYFAAQTYVQLYRDYKDAQYLEKAYKTARSNVNYLYAEQKKLNEAYLADIVKLDTKTGTKEEKKRNKEYNELIEEERKVALAPISEPLLLNCDLLFSLAKELNIPKSEQKKIDSILHENNSALFLSKYIDDKYWYSNNKTIQDFTIDFDKDTIVIPSTYLADGFYIKVTVTDGGNTTEYDDWVVKKVDRKTPNDPYSFIATLKSAGMKKYNYTKDSMVHIEIYPRPDLEYEPLVADFKVSKFVNARLYKYIKFEKV